MPKPENIALFSSQYKAERLDRIRRAGHLFRKDFEKITMCILILTTYALID